MKGKKVNILWLKRDLRLKDHAPLKAAILDGEPLIILYVFEPSIMDLPQSDDRHWRFVFESLTEISETLKSHQQYLNILYGEAVDVFKSLLGTYQIKSIYSHLEIGLKATFDRDKSLRSYFKSESIGWYEIVEGGIVKGKKNRINWEEERIKYLENELESPDLNQLNSVLINNYLLKDFDKNKLPENILKPDSNFQKGGGKEGRALLYSFLEKRSTHYLKNISKAEFTTVSCSRLSPYLSYGCLSIREVYQAVEKNNDDNNKNLEAFKDRLFWRSHLIQKLETEWNLEFEPTNKELKRKDTQIDEELFTSFINGETGFPYIDATIRCLKKTGYADFRMRATLVTFSTFTLWQDWKRVAVFLAKLFLDFEPGIHYSQIQIQAGLTGYHTLRLYSPTAQIEKHDKQGVFVKKWLPELKDVPQRFISKPWKMNESQQKEYNCVLGKDYPFPIVDYEIATDIAKGHYWKNRQRIAMFDELPALFEKFSLPKNIPSYMNALKINKEAYYKMIAKKNHSKSSYNK